MKDFDLKRETTIMMIICVVTLALVVISTVCIILDHCKTDYDLAIKDIESSFETEMEYVEAEEEVVMFDYIEAHKRRLFDAICERESGNKDVVNSMGTHVGPAQIGMLCLTQANTNVGYNRFTSEDRHDKEKSYEIFCAIMDKQNPNYLIREACEIWLGADKKWYYEDVLNLYEARMEEEGLR